jgi:hypothetical protein
MSPRSLHRIATHTDVCDCHITPEEAYAETLREIATYTKLRGYLQIAASNKKFDVLREGFLHKTRGVYESVLQASATVRYHHGRIEGRLAELSTQMLELEVEIEEARNNVTEAERQYEARAIPLYAAVAAFATSGPQSVPLPYPLPLSTILPTTAVLHVASANGEITIDTAEPLTLAEHRATLNIVERLATSRRKMLDLLRHQMAFLRMCVSLLQPPLLQVQKQLRANDELEGLLEDCLDLAAEKPGKVAGGEMNACEAEKDHEDGRSHG